MARQVMFDPFGSYTQGFDQGAGRQIQQEGAVRQARAQDYDFNTVAPYRLAAMQREDQLGAASLPVQKQLLGYTIPNAQANLYDKLYPQTANAAQMLNTPALLQHLLYGRFGLQQASVTTPSGQEQTLFQQGPNGEYIPVSRSPDFGANVLDSLNYPRRLQAAQMGDLQQFRLGQLGNQAGMVDARQTAADAAMARARLQHYPNGITGGSMVGGSGMVSNTDMPNGLSDPSYYQWPDAVGGQQYPQQQLPTDGLGTYNLGGGL